MDFKGNEMFRKDIVKLFYQNLKRDEWGVTTSTSKNEMASLDVEDTAYVVTAVNKLGSPAEGNERISVLLNDETLEELDCKSLRIGKKITFCIAASNPTAMKPGSCGRATTRSQSFSTTTMPGIAISCP